MKDNCILIVAHKLTDSFAFTLEKLNGDFDIYIHLDKKCKQDIELFMRNVQCSASNIYFINRKKVFWGGFSQVEVTYDLLKEAFKKNTYKHFIFISGEDFPSKSNEYINKFLLINDCSFLEYKELPSEDWGFKGGIDRVNRYWLTDFINRKYTRYVGRVLYTFQKLFFIERNKLDLKLYGGCNWFTLDFESVNYIIEFLGKNNNFIKRFKYTRATDEIFFHTILLNNNKGLKIKNNSLRYIDWKSGPEYPKVLTNDDINKVIKSETIFCRKVNNIDLANLLDNHRNIQ